MNIDFARILVDMNTLKTYERLLGLARDIERLETQLAKARAEEKRLLKGALTKDKVRAKLAAGKPKHPTEPPADPPQEEGIPQAERVMRAMAKIGDVATVKQLAEITGLDPIKVRLNLHYLSKRKGMVEPTGDRGCYRLKKKGTGGAA